ncbi:MAG: ATP synthase F1 subunit gamma [Bacteriovoracaceae bacterium]|nr:ATP synthase F1 subunit gamma [Bacteriovoracaceae bacterium]
MANIKGLKKRIKTTKGTLKITKAMKLVSAAKLSKAQQRILSQRNYSDELQSTVKMAAAVAQNYQHPMIEQKDDKLPNILFVISSDKGLCGGYNSGLVKKIRLFLRSDANSKNWTIYHIGKKAKDFLSTEFKLEKQFKFVKADPTIEELRQVGSELSQLYLNNKVGKIFVAYNKFYSAMTYTPTIKQLLPFSLSKEELKMMEGKITEFKCEPGAAEILDLLIPEVYNNSIQTALFDAVASEHGARMVAMESATKNCSSVIKRLTIKMNKLRQAAITTELIEVVSGAESLKG